MRTEGYCTGQKKRPKVTSRGAVWCERDGLGEQSTCRGSSGVVCGLELCDGFQQILQWSVSWMVDE